MLIGLSHTANGCPASLILAKRHINNALHVRYTQTRHHRSDHYTLEKTIYGLKKTIYDLERLFTALK